MRSTTKEAYTIALDSGLLSKRRLEVLLDICENGPCSQLDSWRRIAPNSNSGAITTRFSELERMNLIKPIGEKIDSYTRQNNTVYEVTGNQPKKLERIHLSEAKAQDIKYYESGWDDAIKSILETMKEYLANNEIGYQTRVAIEKICKEVAQ